MISQNYLIENIVDDVLYRTLNETYINEDVDEVLNWDSIGSMNPVRMWRDHFGKRAYNNTGQDRHQDDGGEYVPKPYQMGNTFNKDGLQGPGDAYQAHMDKVNNGQLNRAQLQSDGSDQANLLQQKSQILDDIIGKLKQYMSDGRFGQDEQSLQLANEMKGACDVAKGQVNGEMKRYMSQGQAPLRQVAESAAGEWLYGKAKNLGMFNPMSVAKQNGSGYDTSFGEGQWVSDLRNEIEHAIQLGCWSGGRSAKCLQQVQNFASTLEISHKMGAPLAAGMLALAGGLSLGQCKGPMPTPDPSVNQTITTQTVTPQQGSINFATGSDEISPSDSTYLANMAQQGNDITISPEYSSVGGQYANKLNGAAQNGTLAQARGAHMERIVRGANKNANVRVNQGQLGQQQGRITVRENRRTGKPILSESQLRGLINYTIRREINRMFR